MSGRARTDDDIGVKRPRSSGVSPDKRKWIGQVLGIDLDTLLALDLKTTTTQASAEHAAPMLLRQVNEAAGPLKTLPPAQTPALTTVLKAISTIRTELVGTPTPESIVTMRGQIDKLPDLVNAAVESVTKLQQRQQAAIEKAKTLKYSEDAREEDEGELIKAFNAQQAGVAKAFETGPLTVEQVEAAEESLKLAAETADVIDKAVEERHAAWAKKIRETADGLMKGFSAEVDAALWLKPKTTREAIDKELVPF